MLLAEVLSLHIFRPFPLATKERSGACEWMALRLILLTPSGQPAGGLGSFQAAGGGKSTGRERCLHQAGGSLC